MSDPRSRLHDYLDHILVAIERIERYTEEVDEVAFLQNELIQKRKKGSGLYFCINSES